MARTRCPRDPRLSYGPEPRAVTLLECSDGYVIVLSYGASSLKDAVFLAEALSQHKKEEEEET